MNKSSHLYLYSAFNNTNCVKATAQYQNSNIFELKAFHYWIQWCYRPAQFSLNNICAIKSMISLAMKCPQLRKPEATTARKQNTIGDRTEKKPWEKPGSVGGPVLLWPDEPVVFFPTAAKSDQLVPVVFSRWLSGHEVLTGELSLENTHSRGGWPIEGARAPPSLNHTHKIIIISII